MNTYTIFDNPTLYPSTYMVVSNNGYTKHCYAEAERVCVAQPIQYLPFGESHVCNHTPSPYTERFTFTGKERDEETGYGYFGARYMDHELITMWLSVDPMSDKYPSVTPYNYCAWNPIKLVDPDGREIYLGGLPKEMQDRLCDCLGYIAGLNLFVDENGMLKSSGEKEGKARFSQSAQSDLLKAINDTEKRVSVTTQDHSAAVTESQYSSNYTGDFGVWDGFDKADDAKCFGLGMTFFHELAHAYFGDKDVNQDNVYTYNAENPERPEPDNHVGVAANRVNQYRKEMKMPTRASYDPYHYKEGDPSCWKGYDGKVAFRSKKGIEYHKLH